MLMSPMSTIAATRRSRDSRVIRLGLTMSRAKPRAPSSEGMSHFGPRNWTNASGTTSWSAIAATTAS